MLSPLELEYLDRLVVPKVSFHTNGNIKNIKYSYKNITHNNVGPAFISGHINGNKKGEIYFNMNKIHRDLDLPAYIEYYENGGILFEKYYKNNILHRVGDYAHIEYYFSYEKKVIIKSKQMYINGFLDIDTGKPSRLMYNEDGTIKYEDYFNGSIYHNEFGPARIWWEDGEVVKKEYYVNGVKTE